MIFPRRRKRPKISPTRRQATVNQPRIGLFGVITKTLVILTVLIPTLYLFKSDIFRISSIQCSYDGKQCSPLHLETLNPYRGQISLLLKPSKISQDLLEADPALSEAKTTLGFPRTLNVSLSSQFNPLALGVVSLPELPQFLIITPSASPSSETSSTPVLNPLVTLIPFLTDISTQTIFITNKGQILSDHTDQTTPFLFLTISPESISPSTLARIYHYQEEIVFSAIPIIKGWVVRNDLIIHLKPSIYAVFTLESDPLPSINALQQIRATDTIKSDRVIIDLRFDKPVVSSY